MKDRAKHNALIRRVVLCIENEGKMIASHLRTRRGLYRHAKDLGFDPEIVAALLRERRAGKDRAAINRRKLARLRRIVR
jgi:hypothetical protein